MTLEPRHSDALHPWQRRILEAMLSGHRVIVIQSRRMGKSALLRTISSTPPKL